MHDRVACITGGGSGIGAATAELLAGLGMSLVLVGRRESALLAVAEPLRSQGRAVEICPGDVAEASTARAAVALAVERLGGLDLLVNNAALYSPAPFVEEGADVFRQHFEVNVEGPAHFARAAHAQLAARRGVVVNVLSTLAHGPVPGVAAYSASKAALLSLTKSWALEWAADGIRSVAVAPGVVDTPIHDAADLAGAAAIHPLGRVGQPEEVARAIAFLASEDSAWTTGAVLDVDGGLAAS